MSRNQAFDALLALGLTLPPPGPAGTVWGDSGRRYKDFTKAQLPAIWQSERDTNYSGMLGQIEKRQASAWWMIVHNIGKAQDEIPAAYTADFLDALDTVFHNPMNRQTLGGKVYAAFLKGAVQRYPGDADGIEIITIPFTLLLP